MSLERDVDAYQVNLAEQASRGVAPTGLDKLEAAALALRAVGGIIMCAAMLVAIAVSVFACAG